jgi:hypothetical protein
MWAFTNVPSAAFWAFRNEYSLFSACIHSNAAHAKRQLLRGTERLALERRPTLLLLSCLPLPLRPSMLSGQ